MRRLLAVCGVTVLIYAALAAAPKDRAGTASAAGGVDNLAPIAAVRFEAGCPIGPAFTYCDRVPGTTGPAAIFDIANFVDVKNVSIAFSAIPGLNPNFTTTCTSGGACDFTITSNTCTGNLTAGEDCEVRIAFSPLTTGLRAAALTVTDGAGDSVVFHLEGTGRNLALVPPAGAVGTDNAYTFPSVAVGGASPPATFTLAAGASESGITASFLPIQGLSSQFGAGDFTLVGTGCTGALAPAGTCNLDIEFTPKTAGLRSAVLTATDSNGDSTTIFLAGRTTTGLQIGQSFSNPPACVVVQQAGFCSEPSGGTTPSNMYTLQNISGSQVTGLSVSTGAAPTDFTITGNSCTTTLAAGAACNISVAFTPQAAGLRQGALTVTDAQGDFGALNLNGTGDDFGLQIVPGQTDELTVAQGATVTFMAQAVPDSVFGQNGEQLSLVCPSNLPAFTTCAFTPCPVKISAGTAAPFGIVIVTSSNKTPAPPVANPCPGNSGANAAPGGFDAPSGPSLVLQVAPQTSPGAMRFPAPLSFALVLLTALAAMAFALFGVRVSPRKRVPVIFGVAGLAAAILLGCGGHGSGVSTATPTGVTKLNILANATDSSGNPINASRAFQITLDVVTK